MEKIKLEKDERLRRESVKFFWQGFLIEFIAVILAVFGYSIIIEQVARDSYYLEAGAIVRAVIFLIIPALLLSVWAVFKFIDFTTARVFCKAESYKNKTFTSNKKEY